MPNTLAYRLREARTAAGLTQKDVAERAGMGQPNYSDLERGKNVGTTLLPVIAAVLGVRGYWLATGDGPRDAGDELDIDESEIIALWRAMPPQSRELLLLQFRALRPPPQDESDG